MFCARVKRRPIWLEAHIVIIWATTSANQRQRLHNGLMGYRTPNIDSIAKDG